MKKLAAIFGMIFFMNHTPGHGQLIPYAGVSLGYASSSVKVESPVDYTVDPRQSFAAGLQMEWFDNPIIGMITDIDYWSAGAELDNEELPLDQLSMAQQLALYLPLLSKTWEAYFTTGPQLNYLVKYEQEEFADQHFEQWIFGYRLGVGVAYVFRDFKLSLRGQLASDIASQYEDERPAPKPQISIRNRSYLVTTGFLWEL